MPEEFVTKIREMIDAAAIEGRFVVLEEGFDPAQCGDRLETERVKAGDTIYEMSTLTVPVRLSTGEETKFSFSFGSASHEALKESMLRSL